MKLIIPTHHSRAIQRMSDALAAGAPKGCEIARPETLRNDTRRSRPLENEEKGDVVVMLVNGLHDRFEYQAERCKRRGQKYAVAQIALRTTRQPKTQQWRTLWKDAAVVWSYYPLDKWITEDLGDPVDFNFYHAPLGVDAAVFTPEPAVPRDVMVMTSGQRRGQESVAECDDAVVELGGRIAQLGPVFSLRSKCEFIANLTDAELAAWYRRCQFVSGLRRHEGFELPAAEGLMCGARPLLYDKHHYRDWYGDWAEYIEERGQHDVTLDLRRLFEKGPRPVSAEERTAAASLFDWNRITTSFWAACGVQ